MAVPGKTFGRPFAPGVSGNPGGKARGIERQLREQYGKDVPRIVGILVQLGLGEKVPGYEDAKPSDRVRAASEALDRIVGKAQQYVDVTGGRTSASMAGLSDAELDDLIDQARGEHEDDGEPPAAPG